MNNLKKMALAITFIPLVMLGQNGLKDLNAKIPADKDVKTGVLKNGLTYYIKKNAKPEKKVDLRLIINAGSIQETDQQQGLAHFMEHMCFNGTKNFPKNKLVDYLQSIGVKFGQHLNAYTSFDETVYFLPIPADKPEKIESGFQILEDWAFNTTLTGEEIDKERGVVLEEYRLGLGAGKRMMGRFIPKVMYNSLYAKRLPIGQKEILENFTYDKVISFYKDWYRPNLMAVVVVGDIDVAEMEKKIIAHFSGYSNPKNAKPRVISEVPNHKETFIAIESDKEESNSTVQLMYKDLEPKKKMVTIGDYRKSMVKNMFTAMINERLDQLTNSPTPPFVFGYSFHGSAWAREKGAFQSYAMTAEGKQLDALKVLMTESEKVKKFGFTQAELDRAKASYLTSLEASFNEKDKTMSQNFVQECQNNFLEKDPMPGIAWELAAAKELLPTVTLAETNEVIAKYMRDENKVVVIQGPEKEGLAKATEADVLNTMKINVADIKQNEAEKKITSLLRNPVKAGSVVSKSSDARLGTTTLKLSNGANVTYKKTDFKNDEIIFNATSLGGSNLISNEDYKKIQFAMSAINESGISGLKVNDINKFMSDKKASLFANVGATSENLSGDSTVKDLEYLFQMIHANFTDVNMDKEAYESYKAKNSAMFKNMASNPNMFFNIKNQEFLNKENPRFNGVLPDDKTWEYTDYALAHKYFTQRFSNAADFDFNFVGNIDEKKLEEFAAKYIASIPGDASKIENTKDLGYRNIKGSHKLNINKGTDPKSNVNIQMYGETTYNENERLYLGMMGEILSIKLTEKLREATSGVYTVRASGNMSKIPYGSYNFNISFPCGPENVEKLTAMALEELQKIVDNGPEAKDLEKVRETRLLEYKENVKKNEMWSNMLVRKYNLKTDLSEFLDTEKNVKAVTVENIKGVAKKYATKDKVVSTLLPESK